MFNLSLCFWVCREAAHGRKAVNQEAKEKTKEKDGGPIIPLKILPQVTQGPLTRPHLSKLPALVNSTTLGKAVINELKGTLSQSSQ